jgi:hypothetical protein
MQCKDVSSPTVRTDSVLKTAVNESEENRDIATCDTGSYKQTFKRQIQKELERL